MIMSSLLFWTTLYMNLGEDIRIRAVVTVIID